MNLLAWLVSVRDRVYDFFGSWFWAAREAALNAWSWAYNEAQNALFKARKFVEWVRREVVEWVESWIAYLWGWIDYLDKQISKQRGDIFNDVTAWVLNKINAAIASAIPNINTLIGIIADYFRPSFNWLNAQVLDLLRIQKAEKQRADSLFPRIANFLNWLDAGGLANALSFLQSQISNIVPLLDDLPGTVLAHLRDILWEFLQWVLAYEMGAVNETLPPFPDFSKRGKSKG